MRELPLKYFKRHPAFPPVHPSSTQTSRHPPVAGQDYPVSQLVDVKATTVQLGKPVSHPTFGWDVEYGDETRRVKAFRGSDM